MREWGTRACRMAAAGLTGLGLLGLGAGYASAAPSTPVTAAASGRAQAAGATGTGGGYQLPSDVKRECPPPSPSGTYECMALVRTDLTPSMTGPVGGYGPASLQSAYNLTSAAASRGKGMTVALLTVGDNPTAASDFGAYRAQYKLPACDPATEDGCLTKVNQYGSASLSAEPPAPSSWAAQAAMDADTVAAICPLCHVLLVEAPSAATVLSPALSSAVYSAADVLVAGFGMPHNPLRLINPVIDGVEIAAAAGDDGYGVQFPASSQFVTAVGGTTLTPAPATARGWTETAWAGTGSGCSTRHFKPSWQADTGCAGRTQNDVAAVADPRTGVAFYDTDSFGGWGEGGGTNVAAAVVAATYALAGPAPFASFPTQFPYRAGTGLYPVTSGSDGSCAPAYLCTAGAGYNGPAGLGTPDGTAAFAPPHGNIVTLVRLFNTDFTVGKSPSASTSVLLVDTAPGQSLSFKAAGLPPGLSLPPATCHSVTGEMTYCPLAFQGTPAAAGLYHVTVTAADTTGAHSSITIPVRVADVVTASSYSENATIGSTVSDSVSATSRSGEPLNFTVTGLVPGISWAKTGPDQITFTGSPTAAGQFTTTYTASSPYGGSATGQVNWTVLGTITIGHLPNITSTVGNSAEFTVRAADTAQDPGLAYYAYNLPPGLAPTSYSASDNNWTGWLAQAGTYPVKVTVTDFYGATKSETFTWTVRDSAAGPTGPVQLGMDHKCLDMGTGIRGWNCNGTWAQRWTVAQDGTIRGQGKCLTETSLAFGARVTLMPCTDAASQRWLEETPGDDPSYGPALVNAASQRCLGDPAGYRNGGYVETLACNVGLSKTWTTPAGQVRIGIPGMCLADPANRTANGTRLALWQCHPWREEAFTLSADGSLRIHGRCVYVNPRNTGYGAPVVLEQCRAGDKGELWALDGTGSFQAMISNPPSANDLGVASGTAGNGSPVGAYSGNWQPSVSWHVG